MYDVEQEDKSVWVKINNIDVHIVETDEGVVVDMYARPKEGEDFGEPISSTWATFAEALDEQTEKDESEQETA